MYKQIFGIIVVSIALVGCSDKTPEQGQKAAETVAASPETAPVVPVNVGEFPSGLVPDFKYQIRSKRTEDRGADHYRKLVIEFQEGDAVQIDKRLESSLSALGYRRYKSYQEPNGAIVGDYGRKGHRVTVTTTQLQADMKMLNPASQGTVYLVWKES